MASVLELDVTATDTPGSFRVEIIGSPAGEASGTFRLAPGELLAGLGQLQETLLASSVPSRRLLSRGESSVRAMGERLFDALFSSHDVAAVYRGSCAVAAERGESLRIVLRTSAAELAALPWEAMYDRTADSYVSRREPLIRYVPVASSPPPLAVRLPLQILALVPSPRGLAPLDVEKEKENLTRSLRPLLGRGAVAVTWLEHTTWPVLQDALLTGGWHVLHFIGHGDFDIERDEGVLALETEEGRIHRVPAANFVDLLREAEPMPRLVVLNACESATSSSTDVFSGTAATLVRGGISAVTAMQFEISDPAAIAFCRGFYAAIGRGRGVDDAVRSGRVAILGLGDGSLEWITPTLYLRGTETHLFALTGAPPPAVQESPEQVSVGAAQGNAAPAAARPEERPAPPPRAPSPAETASPQGPAVPVRSPDRLDELWVVAKRISWTNRPFKSDLAPLATSVPAEENLIGCVRLPFSWTTACAVAVTDRAVYLSSGDTDVAGWRALLGRLPVEYGLAADRARIPMADVEAVTIESGHPVLALRGHGPLGLAEYGSSAEATLLTGYVEQARVRAP